MHLFCRRSLKPGLPRFVRRDATTYPLADRSLRVVGGRNADEAASDSNGSGKTTLVMAPLWALTGKSDARAEVRRRRRHRRRSPGPTGIQGSRGDTAS